MKKINNALCILLAFCLIFTCFSVSLFTTNADIIQPNKDFCISNIENDGQLKSEFLDRVHVLHKDTTFTLNSDKTVTMVKGETASTGFALESEEDSEIQQLSGKIYLPATVAQGGPGFIHSKTVGSDDSISYRATTFCLNADEIGGFNIVENYGTVHINADGTPYKGTNNLGGAWGNAGSLYVSNKSVKTTTTIKTYTMVSANASYNTNTEYYTKDENNVFTKHAKDTIGKEVFDANKSLYYTYASSTTNQFNLENPPEDCKDVLSVNDTVYKFTTIATTEGYFNKTGTKGVSLTSLGLSEEVIEKLKSVTAIEDSERMVDYTVRYKGEDGKIPVINLAMTIGGTSFVTHDITAPFYSSQLGAEKALGVAQIFSWPAKDDRGKLTFSDFTATYLVNKEARILDLDNDVRYIGRHYVDNGVHKLGWEQSGFEFSFIGTGATVEITRIKKSTDRAFMNVYVDGVRQVYSNPTYEPSKDLFLETNGSNYYVLASDLPEGPHTIKVIKRTGPMYSSASIDNIYIHQSDNAAICEKPEAPELRIATFGDSITEGMGILSGLGLPSNEDSTLTYAGLAAEAFGAEISDSIAEGGIGVTRCSKDYTLGEVLDYVDYHHYGTEAEHALYQFDSDPNAVVLNIGTNDGASWSKINPTDFVNGLKDLIKKIRSHYPDKPIFYVYGMMKIGDTVIPSITTALSELEAEGIKDIYYIPVKCTVENGEISYANHPNALGHERVSKHLIAKMAEVLGWETADMKNGLSVEKIDDVSYTGSAHTPEITVKLNGTELIKDTDYSVTYENNVNSGVATAKVALIGDYSGYIAQNFNIVCLHDGLELSETTPATCISDGEKSGVCPICSAVVTEPITKTGHEWEEWEVITPVSCLVNGEKRRDCKNCDAFETDVIKAIGKHTPDVRAGSPAGIGVNGELLYVCAFCEQGAGKTVIYAIKTITLSKTSCTYDGKVHKPTVTVKDSKGKTISSKNYTVTYQSGFKSVGKYKVTVKFNGRDYVGTKTLYFTINPKGTSLSSVSAGKKSFTAKWKKQSTGTAGYQIQYSTSKTFKSAKTVTVKGTKTVSKKISHLSAKKTYYVRIRTYKSSGLVSGWSSYKKVTTKK